MEAWEVEEAVAEHFNRVWEEMNDPETTMELKIEQALNEMDADRYADIGYDDINEAWACLETGDFDFHLLDSELERALELIDETPDGDRLVSIKNDLATLRKDMAEVKERIHEAAKAAYSKHREAAQSAYSKHMEAAMAAFSKGRTER